GFADRVDGPLEGFLVCPRRLREAAHLADVLERRPADLVVGRLGLVVEERVDVPAHAAIVAAATRDPDREGGPAATSGTARTPRPTGSSPSRRRRRAGSRARCARRGSLCRASPRASRS